MLARDATNATASSSRPRAAQVDQLRLQKQRHQFSATVLLLFAATKGLEATCSKAAQHMNGPVVCAGSATRPQQQQQPLPQCLDSSKTSTPTATGLDSKVLCVFSSVFQFNAQTCPQPEHGACRTVLFGTKILPCHEQHRLRDQRGARPFSSTDPAPAPRVPVHASSRPQAV